MRIVFMGTPDFSVPCLEALIYEKYNIVGVFTQTDKPVGRKQILTASPVKQKALEYGIPVFQPKSLKNDEAFNELKNLRPDLIVVVAYGKILPKNVLELPKYGCLNIHASLLPKYRGASPIQWAIINGETETGVTAMYMDEGLDTGDIIDSSSVAIDDEDTGETLHNKLSLLGAELLIKTVKNIVNSTVTRIKQGETTTEYAPIINKEMGKLDFNNSAICLNNLVRGFNPWPASYFIFNGLRIKVYKTEVISANEKEAGKLIITNNIPHIVCGDGNLLKLIEICPEGKKKMSGADAVKGRILNNE